jgi:hypothetical protein
MSKDVRCAMVGIVKLGLSLGIFEHGQQQYVVRYILIIGGIRDE